MSEELHPVEVAVINRVMRRIPGLREQFEAIAEQDGARPPEEKSYAVTPLGCAAVELGRGTLTVERLSALMREQRQAWRRDYGIEVLVALGLVARAAADAPEGGHDVR